MLTAIRKHLPPAVWSGLVNAGATFLAVFLPALVGWVQTLTKAISDHRVLPGASVLTSAALAGVSAAFAGLGTYVVRQIQHSTNTGSPPVFTTLKPTEATAAVAAAEVAKAEANPPANPIDPSLPVVVLPQANFEPPANPEVDGTSGEVEPA